MSTEAVGFDVGSLNSFVSYVTGHGIQTVHNEYGDRRIPTFLSFSKGRRLIGMAAKLQHERAKATTTIWNFLPLLGRQYKTMSHEERQSLPFACHEAIGGRVGIEVNHLDRLWTLIPEQLLAMQLEHLRAVTEQATSSLVNSVVISVPVYYTSTQRRAVRDAAHIAGISCTKLVNDTTAIATAYGFSLDGTLHSLNQAHHVAIVSIGYRNTQVAICAISKGLTRILATAHDAQLGGQDFDRVLFETARRTIENKYNIRLKRDSGVFTRLLKECEQLKIRMSTNTAKLSFDLDGVVEGKCVQFSMKRSEYAVLCDELLVRFRKTLLRCLAASGLNSSDIQAVELVGGSCRIPALRTMAALVFEKDATTMLNADEAVARGCAIQAAMCSANFDVHYSVIEPDVQSDTKQAVVPALTVKDLNTLRAAELHMSQCDQEQTRRSMAKNALEDYVYATRDRFEGPLRHTVTDEERQLLDEIEACVEAETSDEDNAVYHERLTELREVVASVEKRRRLAKTNALVITTMDQKPVAQVRRQSKYDQIRRSLRRTTDAPKASSVPIRDITQPVVIPTRKVLQPLVLAVAEKPQQPSEPSIHKPVQDLRTSTTTEETPTKMRTETPERPMSVPLHEVQKPPDTTEVPRQARERRKSEPIHGVLKTVVLEKNPKPRFSRSATMERKHVTGQLNCYNSQKRNSVNSIVSFFEKINDVNAQEAQKQHTPLRSLSPERASSLNRAIIRSDCVLPSESIKQPLSRSKSFHLDQRSTRTMTPTFETTNTSLSSGAQIGPPLDPTTIKATPIVSQLGEEPKVPSYTEVVDCSTRDGIQFRLLDAIGNYRSTISVESRRLYEVLDRYQMYLKRQLQLCEATHNLDSRRKQMKTIEGDIAEAKRIMDEVHHHQTETAQHLSFLDHHRDIMLALADGNGSGPQYMQQTYVKILDTFVQPIWSMLEQAKLLWNVLQDYETRLSQGVRERFVQTNYSLSPVTRFEDRVSNQVSVYKLFVWQHVSCLNNQLHQCLEHMKQQIEAYIEEDRRSRTLPHFVPSPRSMSSITVHA